MSDTRRSTPLPTLFAALIGVTTLAVLLQGVTAGLFVNQEGHDGWVTVHGVIADLTWVSALAAAAVGFVSVRRSHRRIWSVTVALFVLSLAQTGIGHLITDKGMDGLIAVHVPLALVIFGLAIWLATLTTRARRVTAPLEPYADERSEQPLPVSYRR